MESLTYGIADLLRAVGAEPGLHEADFVITTDHHCVWDAFNTISAADFLITIPINKHLKIANFQKLNDLHFALTLMRYQVA